MMQHQLLAARLRRSAAYGVIGAVVAFPAFAQETPAIIETTQPAIEEQEGEPADRVVVTGSRLRTDTFTSASPMSVITAEEAETQGLTSVASMLQSATVAAGSSQITSATTLQFVTQGGLGTETLSLRGLGAQRTLVLLDGRRAGPAGTRGSVGPFDLNVVPLSAIERVEILKDGASSIYGSDAIAGVVNLITKKDTGSSIDLSYSHPEQGGAEELRVSGTYGQELDNGYFRVSADYYNRKELARGDRDFFNCGQPYAFRPDGSRADVVDPRSGDFRCGADLIWGHNWLYDYATNPDGAFNAPWNSPPMLMQYDFQGTMGQYIPDFNRPGFESASGIIAPQGWYPVGYGDMLQPGRNVYPQWLPFAEASEGIIDYDHPFLDQLSLLPSVERMSIVASGEYNLSDTLTLYGDALLNRRTTHANAYTQVWTFQYQYTDGSGEIFGDPIALENGWSLRQDGNPYLIAHSPTGMSDWADDTVQIDYMRFVAGARGDLGATAPGWEWDTSIQFTRSEGRYKEQVQWQDAVRPYYNRTESCVGTVTVNRGVPCIDINWYDPQLMYGNPSPEVAAFLNGTIVGNTVYEQTTIEAFLTGDLLELPAGPLATVIGFQYQDDRIDDRPSDERQNGWVMEEGAVVRSGRTVGNDDTRAAFVEFGIPVFEDLPAIHSLGLTLSGRYTDVASYGGAATYKAGLNWEITPEIRVRASKGTSFRTPSLFELYLADEVGGAPQSIDPCALWGENLADGLISQTVADNCAADGIGPIQLGGGGIGAQVITSGGIGFLTAEESESQSLGVVWAPSFADLQFSVDYYDIEVTGQVGRVSNAYILNECYEAEDFPANAYCQLFERNAPGTAGAGQIARIFNNYLNIAAQRSRGLDFEARYRQETFLGDLTVQLQATRTLEDSSQILPGEDFEEGDGEAGEPPWVANLGFTLRQGPWEGFWGVEYYDATSEVSDYVDVNGTDWTYLGTPADFILSTPPVFYHNISLGYDFGDGLFGRFGISNVLDEEPPIVSQAATGSGGYARVGNAVIESQYDLLGRTYFLNVSKSF